MAAKLARAVCDADCLRTKEFFEATETFARVRKRVRRPVVADLCCGHGLTGMLFAVFEPQIDRVELVDRSLPPYHEPLLEAVASVAPWVRDKVRFRPASIGAARGFLPGGVGVVAVHACGARTDRVLDLAMEKRGPVAVVPCCYSKMAFQGSPGIRSGLGLATATDAERTLRLERAGYSVRWTRLPDGITKMPRILMATPAPAPDPTDAD